MMLQLGDERPAWATQRLRCVTSELSLDCSTGTLARSELVIRLGSALVASPNLMESSATTEKTNAEPV
jgi:hypothetical protein